MCFELCLLVECVELMPSQLNGSANSNSKLLSISRRSSYRALSTQMLGANLQFVTQSVLIVHIFGALLSFIVAISTMMTAVINSLLSEREEEAAQAWLYRTVVLVTSYLIVLPMALTPTLGAFKYTSFLSSACVMFIALVLVYEYATQCGAAAGQGASGFCLNPVNPSDWFSTSLLSTAGQGNDKYSVWRNSFLEESESPAMDVLSVVIAIGNVGSLMTFAYVNNQNILQIYSELSSHGRATGLSRRSGGGTTSNHKTPLAEMNKVVLYSTMFVMGIYIVVGVFGYSLFGEATCGNILLNDYGSGSALMTVTVIVETMLVITASPFQVYAFRINCFYWLEAYRQWRRRNEPSLSARAGLLSKEQNVVTTETIKETGGVWYYLIPVIEVTICALIAIVLKDITFIFSLLGSTTYPMIAFVLPSLFYRNVTQPRYLFRYYGKRLEAKELKRMQWRRMFTSAMAVFVCVLSAVSLFWKVYLFWNQFIVRNPVEPLCYSSS